MCFTKIFLLKINSSVLRCNISIVTPCTILIIQEPASTLCSSLLPDTHIYYFNNLCIISNTQCQFPHISDLCRWPDIIPYRWTFCYHSYGKFGMCSSSLSIRSTKFARKFSIYARFRKRSMLRPESNIRSLFPKARNDSFPLCYPRSDGAVEMKHCDSPVRGIVGPPLRAFFKPSIHTS